MTVFDALQIVLDLARQNVIDDPEMSDEEARQREALEIVEHLANQQEQ